MSLEKTIKFYEKNLPKEKVSRVKKELSKYLRENPLLFSNKETYQNLYSNRLILEYLNHYNFK